MATTESPSMIGKEDMNSRDNASDTTVEVLLKGCHLCDSVDLCDVATETCLNKIVFGVSAVGVVALIISLVVTCMLIANQVSRYRRKNQSNQEVLEHDAKSDADFSMGTSSNGDNASQQYDSNSSANGTYSENDDSHSHVINTTTNISDSGDIVDSVIQVEPSNVDDVAEDINYSDAFDVSIDHALDDKDRGSYSKSWEMLENSNREEDRRSHVTESATSRDEPVPDYDSLRSEQDENRLKFGEKAVPIAMDVLRRAVLHRRFTTDTIDLSAIDVEHAKQTSNREIDNMHRLHPTTISTIFDDHSSRNHEDTWDFHDEISTNFTIPQENSKPFMAIDNPASDAYHTGSHNSNRETAFRQSSDVFGRPRKHSAKGPVLEGYSWVSPAIKERISKLNKVNKKLVPTDSQRNSLEVNYSADESMWVNLSHIDPHKNYALVRPKLKYGHANNLLGVQ